jgi:transposase
MTTHRDLTTPEEVLAALRAGERVEVNVGGPWVASSLTTNAHESGVADALRDGLRYRARPADLIPRTFTAAEVAEVVRGIAVEWRAEAASIGTVYADALENCADELHERITHWLRENEG